MSQVVVGDQAPLAAAGLTREMSALTLMAAKMNKHTPGVIVISLCFQSAQHCLALNDLELHALDLVVEEAVKRHFGDLAA